MKYFINGEWESEVSLLDSANKAIQFLSAQEVTEYEVYSAGLVMDDTEIDYSDSFIRYTQNYIESYLEHIADENSSYRHSISQERRAYHANQL